MSSLKLQTATGIKWQVGASILQKIISFGATIILARHLGPSSFGLFAFALVIIGSFELFKSMGIDSALIRKEDNLEKALNTAFIIIPILGIVIYLILNFSASFIGNILGNKDLIPILRLLGLVFVINCFTRIPTVILEKGMKFREISIAELSSSLCFSCSAVLFAFLNFDVWSLVFAYIIKIMLYSILIWKFAKWKPRFQFDKHVALEMLNFGKFIFLGSVVWFLRMNLDNLLVGKLLGVSMLGFYAVGFNLANFIADYFGSKVFKVIYPAYSKLQSNLDNLRTAFLNTFKYTSIIALPFGIGVLLLGGEFLKLVYGERWIGAISVTHILAWAGIFNTLSIAISVVFLTCGKPKIGFYLTSLQVVIFFILIAPMAKFFSIAGVGVVVSMSSLIVFILSLYQGMKLLSLHIEEIYSALKPAFISSLFMALGLIFLKNILIYSKLFSLLNFFLSAIIAILIYSFCLFKIERALVYEIKQMVSQS